jgi:hypothetical protein
MKPRRRRKSFRKELDRLLMAHGRHFKGIALQCRHCGEPAYAATVEMAQTFGWSAIRHVKGPNYTGLCIDCGKKPKA